MNDTEKGVVGGGAVGAGLGALIGRMTHHTGAGALIGAGVGAVGGGLAGSAIDDAKRKEHAAEAAAAAAQARGPLGLTDIVNMTSQGVSEDLIISQINSSGSVFRLSSNDTIWLSQNHVSDRVIRAMLDTATRPPVARVPVYQPVQPVYVMEPTPPPAVRVGFGFYH
jgi:hypothetical protein